MFSKQTEYAIRGLVYILLQNMEGHRPGYREVAEEISSPVQYMAKVLQIFTRHGVISSARGRGGGFFFATPGLPLPLIDVIRLTEGEKSTTRCGFGWESCDPDNPCPMHESYMPVREKLDNLVKNESVQSLAARIKAHQAVLNRLKSKNSWSHI